ncbi:MAG: insulinase family protein [Oceanospirillaceae bacterium]|nr:insulinase family protein [Oceanospirillaceae bacterium]MCP5349410.1 insulinase family protein [Oceanospirillaceae bacterium]
MRTASSAKPNQVHPDFKWLRSEYIDSLSLLIEEYEHNATGARHYHMHTENDENVFLVAVRTMPEDSTGVAHILEHTALCGSEKYPVRDPFFMMVRRSLNTFMNAFTSSDWTAYPFASKNKKDFSNLLSVYLDAVFFARLDPLDFAQEGHRLEFAEPNNPESELQFKGVVFNEMKGAMSSPVSVLWQTFTKYIYPTNTYHHNSGGEPDCITDLSYEQLKAFYQAHYHPSNAIFMTFGDISAFEHHAKFAEYLNRFERSNKKISVADEKRYCAPVRVQEAYNFESEDGLEGHTHHVVGWLLGHSTQLDEQLEAQFLSNILLENSSSPLRHALETTQLGSSPSPLCGLEDSNKEMCFVCGVEGSDLEDVAAVEKLVLDTLRDVAEKGVSPEQIEAVLHQLELSQREIGGDGYPYGLQLILSSLGAATHYGDPISALNLDAALLRLREKAQNSDFVRSLIEKHLLDNPHRVTLSLYPDDQFNVRKEAAEKLQLQKIAAALTAEDKSRIVAQAKALEDRQAQVDDESLLPKVTLQDVAGELLIPGADIQIVSENQNGYFYKQGTNGLVYQQLIMDLPALSDDEILLLPLLTQAITEVGSGELDYLQTQQKQSLICGNISSYSTIRSALENEQNTLGYWSISGKALARNGAAFSDLIQDTLLNARFDEHRRIKELIAQNKMRKEQSITGHGHNLAMGLAASGMAPSAKVAYQVGGLPSILRLRELVKKLEDNNFSASLANQLAALRNKLSGARKEHVLITDAQHIDNLSAHLKNSWQIAGEKAPGQFSLPHVRECVNVAWIVPSQVSFCAKAYPTVAADHPDAPALTVLGGFLRNGFLHTAIREKGGAYGGGASQDNGSACFKFYSYRDPRFTETLQDFDRAIEWMLKTEHSYSMLEQAILGVISSIDKPGSPAGEAKQAYHNQRSGRTPQWRNQFRQNVLKVSLEDLKRVTRTYLHDKNASTGVLIPKTMHDQAEKRGMKISEL